MTTSPAATESAVRPAKGDRVVLDGLPGGSWTTVVEGAAPGVLHLAPPILGGREVALPLHQDFTINFSVREIPHEVDAALVRAPGADGDRAYEARLAGPARRIQRRGAVRVPVNLLVHAQLGAAEDGDGDRPPPPVGATTENLSAGGALMRLDRPVELGVAFPVVVHCGGDVGDLELMARAVRCDRMDAGGRPWRVAIAFLDLTTAQEDALVRFVFERQRTLRRREAGLA